jgi:F0F1-type ATP synthase membrane subunit c/vacuolar-type H+-ATPase subunit K
MEILKLVGAGLIVIGAGLGIGRIGGSAMDALLVNQKLQENSNSYAYRSCLLKVLVLQLYRSKII